MKNIKYNLLNKDLYIAMTNSKDFLIFKLFNFVKKNINTKNKKLLIYREFALILDIIDKEFLLNILWGRVIRVISNDSLLNNNTFIKI